MERGCLKKSTLLWVCVEKLTQEVAMLIAVLILEITFAVFIHSK